MTQEHSADCVPPEQERIGTLIAAKGRWSEYTAKCATCAWSWTGSREKAEKHMHSHASLVHPKPIPIYRETSDTTPEEGQP